MCVEGIETQDELRTVNNLYADTCQGYYTSKPLDADTFARELIAHPDCFQSRSARADKQERNNTMLSDNDLLRTMMNATPLSINVWNEKIREYRVQYRGGRAVRPAQRGRILGTLL